MRRVLTLIAAIAMFVGVMVGPAAADDPVVFTDSVTFDALNPCTGLVHTVTIDFLIWVVETPDDVTVRVRRTGETSDGYVMGHGKETFFGDASVADGMFRDPWNNTDTGQSFEAAGRFLEVDGEVLVDDFRLACTSGPTILP